MCTSCEHIVRESLRSLKTSSGLGVQVDRSQITQCWNNSSFLLSLQEGPLLAFFFSFKFSPQFFNFPKPFLLFLDSWRIPLGHTMQGYLQLLMSNCFRPTFRDVGRWLRMFAHLFGLARPAMPCMCLWHGEAYCAPGIRDAYMYIASTFYHILQLDYIWNLISYPWHNC